MLTSEADIERVIANLRLGLEPGKRIPTPNTPGIYAVFLRTPSLLQPFSGGVDGLIYVGMSESLATREFDMHFSSGKTGISTLRRSLGALLKHELDLKAQPRPPGAVRSNYTCYRFDPAGEVRLTDWMKRNLLIGVHPASDPALLEKAVVKRLRPLLNLTNWPNPHRKEIKRFRKFCVEEALASQETARP